MTTRKPTCQLCQANEATCAMQFIGEARPSFSWLGSHYRGFPVTKVCDDCAELALPAATLMAEGVCVYTAGQADRLTAFLRRQGHQVTAVGDGLLGITYTISKET